MTVHPDAPVADADSKPFWDGLVEHRIVLQRCDDCAEIRFPALPACRACGSTAWSSVDVTGAGSIYSWVTVHRPFSPAFTDEVPYTVATVDLDDGPRMVGRVTTGEPTFGARVAAVFHDHPDWTELRFATTEGA